MSASLTPRSDKLDGLRRFFGLPRSAPYNDALRLARELEKEGTCKAPPPGWACKREDGHAGPCAAFAVNPAEPALSPRDAARAYTLIVRMFRNPDIGLRSMMAQDLCRILKVGTNAPNAATRSAHISAASSAIAADQKLFPTAKPAEPVYFIRPFGGARDEHDSRWQEASEEVYNMTPENSRRVLYTRPAKHADVS